MEMALGVGMLRSDFVDGRRPLGLAAAGNVDGCIVLIKD